MPSPFSTSLYRTARGAVTLLAIASMLAQILNAQFGRTEKSKTPRALGVLQFAPNGKARLIPITILVDGKFYDAGVYKAAPVPVALEHGTVYEAVRTGVSQGLFTITDVLQSKDAWIAEGSWLAAGAAPPKTKHAAEQKPIMGDIDAPPTLRHATSKPAGESTSESKSPTPPPSQSPTPPATQPSTSASTTAPATNAPPSTSSTSQTSTSSSTPEDKDRPVLHRGKPTQTSQPEQFPPVPAKGAAKGRTASPAPSSKPSAPISTGQLLPAISDADGPDLRPYTYSMKPEEEQGFRKKMLALAADEISNRAKQIGAIPAESAAPAHSAQRPRRPSGPAKASQPTFDDVQLQVFDLFSVNEPILVLTATARMPYIPGSAQPIPADLQYFVTLIARNDIYGELHKVFSSMTDTRHLDVIPRLELIDAVDADGDGRGELLFRTISDAGSAYSVYRVVGDRAYPLFEGTPQ